MGVNVKAAVGLLAQRREQLAAEADTLDHAAAVVARLAEGRVGDVLAPMLAAAEKKVAKAEAEAAARRAAVDAAQGRLDAAEAALAEAEAAHAAGGERSGPRDFTRPEPEPRDPFGAMRAEVAAARREVEYARNDPRFGLVTLERTAARARARRDAIARAVELAEAGPLLPVLAAAVDARRAELGVLQGRRDEMQSRLDGIEEQAAADHAAAVAALVAGGVEEVEPSVASTNGRAAMLREALEVLDARVADAEAALLTARAEYEEAEGQVVGGVIAALERAHRAAYDAFVEWTEQLRADTPAPVNRARPAARRAGWRPSPLHDVVVAALNGHAAGEGS